MSSITSPSTDDSVEFMTSLSPDVLIKQSDINSVCSCLARHHIQTKQDLMEHFDTIVKTLRCDPSLASYTDSQYFDVFKKALQAYSAITEVSCTLKDSDYARFSTVLASIPKRPLFDSPPRLTDVCDLHRVTRSYDKLSSAHIVLKQTHEKLLTLLDDEVVCPHIILGAGDTATTIWTEKYKLEHSTTQECLAQKKLPDVLMLGDSAGSWKHDYTLAQPHSLLERGNSPSNPYDYVSTEYYEKNPYANARHIYQANQVVLAATHAPLLQNTKVLQIETKALHEKDWKHSNCGYRLIMKTPVGIKVVYTQSIDICTGLGLAKSPFSELRTPDDLELLMQFDPVKRFTPIVDGNKFMLTGSEEESSAPRTIVVYGGGGTAAACYRKGFFNTDIHTESRPFDESLRKNKMLWIAASGFGAAGPGKLVTAAKEAATRRNELFIDRLQSISHDPTTGKLTLRFNSSKEIECDQLVYSTGQESSDLKKLCAEIESSLSLELDDKMVPLNVSSADQHVHFFGAAAMSIKTREYGEATWKWLYAGNVGPDVGPGSMPPSRAQIKAHTASIGLPLHTVNVNIDSLGVITQFLQEAGLPPTTVDQITQDILSSRKHSPAGLSHSILQKILSTHQVNDKIAIRGHGHLEKL